MGLPGQTLVPGGPWLPRRVGGWPAPGQSSWSRQWPVGYRWSGRPGASSGIPRNTSGSPWTRHHERKPCFSPCSLGGPGFGQESAPGRGPTHGFAEAARWCRPWSLLGLRKPSQTPLHGPLSLALRPWRTGQAKVGTPQPGSLGPKPIYIEKTKFKYGQIITLILSCGRTRTAAFFKPKRLQQLSGREATWSSWSSSSWALTPCGFPKQQHWHEYGPQCSK